MKTRKQKIEFLKGLMKGKRNIQELRPVKNYAFMQDKENPDLFHEINKERILTQAQIDKLKVENPNSHIFILTGVSPEMREDINNL